MNTRGLDEEHEVGPDYWEDRIMNTQMKAIKEMMTIPTKEGVKYDKEKPRLDLIPKEVMDALGNVLSYGAAKYGDHNWADGMEWGRIFAALQRHTWAWQSGEDTDPESGLPHLHHALANIAFLIAYQARGIGKDNRHKS